MKSFDLMNYNPTAEKLVDVLSKKTQNNNPLFFRILVGYYFSKVASMMRCTIHTHDRGNIPINMYAINLASSGKGKGHSTNIMEERVINQFREAFLEDTFPLISEENLTKITNKRSAKNQSDWDEELEKVEKEFSLLGTLLFSFDGATTAAVKQMRHKLLMANAGSMNLEIDEIGSNLLGNTDVLTTFLELFDVGKVKQKLIKNTTENIRGEAIEGRTPTSMMLFGTHTKLLDGGKIEDAFLTMLETGYARRCFFGFTKTDAKGHEYTAEQIYDMLTDTTSDDYLKGISTALGALANRINFAKTLQMTKEVSIELIEYQLKCVTAAANLGDHDEIRKAEVTHRYFKALKLAGAYAFIDGDYEITLAQLHSAIKLTEDSGEAFSLLLTRERNYAKLAKYIASVGREVTHVDMVEELPFYKGSESQKREMMTLAIAYGYNHNIIIKKIFNHGIEFLRGESLETTDLDKITVAFSTDWVTDYLPKQVAFADLHKLTQQPDYHWVNHALENSYRNEENAIPGFNIVVLDVDDGVSLDTAKLLLNDYTYHMYTTKRHTDPCNRFRIILPMSHTLKLCAADYKEFMDNIYEWLPFDVDTQTNQRSRKWMSHKGTYYENTGAMLDALQFIPKTVKNNERKQYITDTQSLSNLERWFVSNTGLGNRSNQLIRYALLLVDSGMNYDCVCNNVLGLNKKLANKLDEAEVLSTILVTATKAIHKRDSQ